MVMLLLNPWQRITTNFGPDRLKAAEILLEYRFLTGNVLETLQTFNQPRIEFLWKPINIPICTPIVSDQTVLPEIPKVLGEFYLGLLKNLLQVTDAGEAVLQQMHNPKPGRITQTFVNRNDLHSSNTLITEYFVNGISFE
ncbi:MAG: hypothetical protein M2R45_03209 [Verrucomicrobia subdivision 3 bacterium]|nr:hypothetical protein [Limisphaerales bacterium]MCS1413924.1 hypothetical protein [Limisphaerales bacterium]